MPGKAEKLQNGVTLLTEPVAASNSVAIGFWFSVGSRIESKENYGITHFTEHMIFKGTSSLKARDISCAFDVMGGYINAWTDKENICVHCVVPSLNDNFQKALGIICDMTENSLFDETEIQKERKVIQSEIVSALDDPEECSVDAVAKIIWNVKGLAHSVGGSVEDVEKITREQLFSWYKKYIKRGNLHVCIAGNFDVDFAAKFLTENLSKKNPEQIDYTKVDSALGKNGSFFKAGNVQVKSSFGQQQIFAVFPFKNQLTKKDVYSLLVLDSILGGTTSSRLFTALREDSGLCYNVSSYIVNYCGASIWYGYVSCERNKTNEVLKLLNSQLSLENMNFSDQEINNAKEHLCGEEFLAGQDSEFIAKRLDRNFWLGFDLADTEETLQDIRSVTKNDIMDCARLLFGNQKSIVVYGSRFRWKF